MKRPKEPPNFNFWMFVLKCPDQVKAFQERGNQVQRLYLERARRYVKWNNIQLSK